MENIETKWFMPKWPILPTLMGECEQLLLTEFDQTEIGQKWCCNVLTKCGLLLEIRVRGGPGGVVEVVAVVWGDEWSG